MKSTWCSLFVCTYPGYPAQSPLVAKIWCCYVFSSVAVCIWQPECPFVVNAGCTEPCIDTTDVILATDYCACRLLKEKYGQNIFGPGFRDRGQRHFDLQFFLVFWQFINCYWFIVIAFPKQILPIYPPVDILQEMVRVQAYYRRWPPSSQ